MTIIITNNFYLWQLIILLLCFFSCQNDKEKALKEKLASIELSDKHTSTALTPALIKEYRQAELAINHRYINDINLIISEDFTKKNRII